ncbi:MAG: DUF5320 domain-containing protein [Bacteroidales bacterium]|nr:DUF5320 domain-containing protein [Bacteroidales bacterium]
MPAGDRTGPMGQGSRTGRALGLCTGYDSPGYTKGFGGGMGRGFGSGRGAGMGRGFGMGRGRGMGRNWFTGSPFSGFSNFFPFNQGGNREDEIKMLKSQSEALIRAQKDIEKRLEELENQK